METQFNDNLLWDDENSFIKKKSDILKEKQEVCDTFNDEEDNKYEVITTLKPSGRIWYFGTHVLRNGEADEFDLFPPEKGSSEKGEIGEKPSRQFVKLAAEKHLEQCRKVASLLAKERRKKEQEKKAKRIKTVALIGICSLFVIGTVLSFNPDIVDRVTEMLHHLNDLRPTPTPTPTLNSTPTPASTQISIYMGRIAVEGNQGGSIKPVYFVKPTEKLTILVEINNPSNHPVKIEAAQAHKNEGKIDYDQQKIIYTVPKKPPGWKEVINIYVLDSKSGDILTQDFIRIRISDET